MTLAVKTGPSFYSSVLSATEEPFVHGLVQRFGTHLARIYDETCERLEVEAISPGHALSAVLPPSNTELLDGSYARALSKIKLGPLRVQATICNAVLKQSHHMLRKAVLQPFDAVDMTPSDSAHILAVTSRGQLTRVLSSCLWYKEHRMGPKEFIAWFRFHYNLPQLLRGDTLRMVAGTAMTTCCATQQCIEEEALLDPQLEHT